MCGFIPAKAVIQNATPALDRGTTDLRMIGLTLTHQNRMAIPLVILPSATDFGEYVLDRERLSARRNYFYKKLAETTRSLPGRLCSLRRALINPRAATFPAASARSIPPAPGPHASTTHATAGESVVMNYDQPEEVLG